MWCWRKNKDLKDKKVISHGLTQTDTDFFESFIDAINDSLITSGGWVCGLIKKFYIILLSRSDDFMFAAGSAANMSV